MADDREDFGEDFERLDRDIHRQILERLNAARRPEDLQDLGLDEPEGKELRIARSLLQQRNVLGPFGFTHLKQLGVVKGIDRKLIDVLIRLCGPASRGRWDALYQTRLPDGTAYHVAHAIVVHTGKVLFLPEADSKTTMLWDASDLVNPQFEFMVDQPDEFLFCTGHTHMTDGRVLVAGGGGGGPSGVNRAYKFDPVAKTWTRTTADMSEARWYPTLVTLADDSHILVVGGAPSNGTTEIYDEATDSFAMMTGPGSTRRFLNSTRVCTSCRAAKCSTRAPDLARPDRGPAAQETRSIRTPSCGTTRPQQARGMKSRMSLISRTECAACLSSWGSILTWRTCWWLEGRVPLEAKPRR